MVIADYICLAGESIEKPLTIFDPDETWKRMTLENWLQKTSVPLYERASLYTISPRSMK